MARVRESVAQFSGRLGNVVYTVRDGELFASPRPVRRRSSSLQESAGQHRLVLAGQYWAGLPIEQIEEWRSYAATVVRVNSAGVRVSPRPDNLFRGLASKYLQVHGMGATPPLTPPDSAFLGDGIAVSAAATPEGVAFTASGPNSEGVLTEVLLQRLERHYHVPKANGYRSFGFVAFAGSAHVVPVRSGAYACAIRFVRASTGQESLLLTLGVVQVGGLSR